MKRQSTHFDYVELRSSLHIVSSLALQDLTLRVKILPSSQRWERSAMEGWRSASVCLMHRAKFWSTPRWWESFSMGWGSGVRVCRMIPLKLGSGVARGIKMSYFLPSGYAAVHTACVIILCVKILQLKLFMTILSTFLYSDELSRKICKNLMECN